MANALDLHRNRTIGFIDWFGPVWSISSIATENEFWNASEGDTPNNCYGANPFPTGRSKRQKSKTVSKGTNSTENEKRTSEVTVDAAASGGAGIESGALSLALCEAKSLPGRR